MRNLMLILIMVPTMLMAQPKKSSKIIITTSDSVELAEKTIVGLLLQDGYGIHFIDKVSISGIVYTDSGV